MNLDPLDQNEEWFFPCLPGQQSIPRNFKLAFDMASALTPKPQLEFTFYNFVADEFIIVEPVESLHLMLITVERADGLTYVTTAIDISDWISLKSQLMYIGLV